MHSFRRAAVRMLAAQPARHLAPSRLSAFRIIPRQTSIPTLARSFQSARILLAENSESSDIAKEENTIVENAEQSASAAAEAVQAAAAPVVDALSSATKDAQSSSAELSPSKTQVFIRNIPHELSSEELTQAFEPFGAIVNTMVATFPDGKSRGWALVEYAEETAATNAIEGMHEKEVGGRRLFVAQHTPKSKSRPASRPAESSTNKIYITNLPFSISDDGLREVFEKFGNVVDVHIAKHSDGAPRGFAHLEFSDVSAVQAAIAEMNASDMNGRLITVQQAADRKPRRAPREGGFVPREGGFQPRRPVDLPPSASLYIGNMSFQMSDRDLNDTFRDIQKVLDVRVAIDRRTGQPRGFAHADFVDVEAATKAKAILERKVIYGRQLRVGYSKSVSENREAAE